MKRENQVLLAVSVGTALGIVYIIKRKKRKKGQKVPAVLTSDELLDGVSPDGIYTVAADGSLLRGTSKSGMASRRAETVPYHLERLLKNETVALAWEELPYKKDKCEFSTWTWREYILEIRAAAAAMIVLGLKPREGCAILGFNSKEWLVADLGAILAGGFATGIYSTNGPEAVFYILEHARCRICICQGEKQRVKVEMALDQNKNSAIKDLVIVTYDDHNKTASTDNAGLDWSTFIAKSIEKPESYQILEERSASQKPGDCSTLIYTSGTTGNPKAVMISHDNITWVVASFAHVIAFNSIDKHRLVSYLPLSHIAAQAIDIYAGLCLTSEKQEVALYFARPDALKGSLKSTLCAVRPTVFFGVPRVYQKFAEALQAVGAKSTGAKKHIAKFAKSVAAKRYARQQANSELTSPGLIQLVLEGFALKILHKVHAAIGLDQCYFVFTGAAPIDIATLEYFGSLGLVVNEAFGMSELAGPASITLNPYYLPGSCGLPVPGVEIKIGETNNEVLFRGRSLMMGYLREPQKTRETIDDEGWLHSGDTGKLIFPQGPHRPPLLKITGRIKELLITAGGENVAPVPIEDALKSGNLRQLISNVVVIGDKLKFLSALFTLHHEPKDEAFSDALALGSKTLDPSCSTAADAQDSPIWNSTIQAAIDHYNSKVAVSQAQKVQKFAILDSDFSQATGELTPTLKLKRSVVTEKYAPIIKKIYGSAASAVWSS